MTKARHGIYAAAISPFRSDTRLDVTGLADYCRYLLGEGGCDGVAPLGTTGESNSIALEDRIAVPAALAQAGIASDRVIIGTGAPAVHDAIQVTKSAIAAGYPNVLVLPPFYYKNVSDDGLFEFYATLIDAIDDPQLRIYLYHFPQMSATPITPDLAIRLRTAYGPIIAGLKDSSGDFEQSRAFVAATGGVEAGFDIYPSSESLLFEGLAAGCAGIISGSTNVTANHVQDAQKLDGAARTAAYDKIKAARDAIAQFPMVAAMKQAQTWRSGDERWLQTAPPLRPLTAEQAERLRSDLDRILG